MLTTDAAAAARPVADDGADTASLTLAPPRRLDEPTRPTRPGERRVAADDAPRRDCCGHSSCLVPDLASQFDDAGGGTGRTIARLLIGFEALPVVGLVVKTVVLWNIDAIAPAPIDGQSDRRVVLLIPTYNEPIEVIAPAIAAACHLEPAHATWVLDDGDRPWVAELCAELGARYIARPVHDHAKAGNMNYALALLGAEGAGDIIAVVDCDHVPCRRS